MILERLDGKDTAKLIEKPSFHDIHYVREMLFSVFCALDVSQKQLGFHHSDLRLANIMDIGPEAPGIGAGMSKARGQQPLTFPASTVPNGEGPGMPSQLAVQALSCCAASFCYSCHIVLVAFLTAVSTISQQLYWDALPLQDLPLQPIWQCCTCYLVPLPDATIVDDLEQVVVLNLMRCC